MIEYKKSTWDIDKIIIKELCGAWWKDSLFFKACPCEYIPSEPVIDQLYEMGAILYTIGYDGDKPISCYVAFTQYYIFNPTLIIGQEIVWCIAKEHRNFRNFIGLVDAIDKLMVESGVDFYSLASSCEDKYESLGKYLSERKGFVLMEKIYMKKVSNG